MLTLVVNSDATPLIGSDVMFIWVEGALVLLLNSAGYLVEAPLVILGFMVDMSLLPIVDLLVVLRVDVTDVLDTDWVDVPPIDVDSVVKWWLVVDLSSSTLVSVVWILMVFNCSVVLSTVVDSMVGTK